MPPINERFPDNKLAKELLKPKTIGIVGSRRCAEDRHYWALLREFEKHYREGDRLVSGGCPVGGDHFAEIIAERFGCTITIHYPNWAKFKKAAGPIRNTKVAEDCTILLALVAPDRTGGTEDCVNKVIILGKPVYLIEESTNASDQE